MCYQCEQNDKQNDSSALCISKRSFLKLSAASAVGLSMASAGIAKADKHRPVGTVREIPPKPENVLGYRQK